MIRLGDEPAPPITEGQKIFPEIHGAETVGVSPGKPFLHLIPATGAGPLYYEARGLPQGLLLNTATGVISGVLLETGSFEVELIVTGSAGQARKSFRIIS